MDVSIPLNIMNGFCAVFFGDLLEVLDCILVRACIYIFRGFSKTCYPLTAEATFAIKKERRIGWWVGDSHRQKLQRCRG